MDFIFFLAGLALLYFGGEKLIQGSVAIAGRLGLSTLLVSMVIIGFGTSTPELLVSVQAALKGSSDIALGNIVGSNICNILLILGISAFITRVSCDSHPVRRDAAAVAAASLLLVLLCQGEALGRVAGAGLFVLLAGYLYYCVTLEHKTKKERKADSLHEKHITADHAVKPMAMPKAAAITVISLGALMLGANLMVTAAVSMARKFGVSEAVIGLTLVAVGTSLPELATAIVAARKKHHDVIIGNILGSNLFNILGILGITGIVAPITVTPRIAAADVWVMLAAALALLFIIYVRKVVYRMDGVLFLSAYAAYLAWLCH